MVYDFLLRHQLLLNLEHGILIGVGLIFWWPVLSGTARSLAAPGGLLYLFIAFASSAFLGLALTFLPSFYTYYQHTPRLWGFSPDSDQNVGGALMTGEQSAVFVAGMCWIFFRLLDDDQEVESDERRVAPRARRPTRGSGRGQAERAAAHVRAHRRAEEPAVVVGGERPARVRADRRRVRDAVLLRIAGARRAGRAAAEEEACVAGPDVGAQVRAAARALEQPLHAVVLVVPRRVVHRPHHRVAERDLPADQADAREADERRP